MYVYVVGWHPATDSGANGGFEWRYNRTDAIKEAMCALLGEATNDGPEHNVVFAKIRVPFEVDHDRPRTYSDREDDITEWLDNNMGLFELPQQEWAPEELEAKSEREFRAAHPEAYES